jgi:glycosyltransferase involved in cell wall biosynthesis
MMQNDAHSDTALPGLAVLIPCFNAGNRVRPVVEGALGWTPHVLVVDDGSTDDGIESLADLESLILTQPSNQGKGFALLAGFQKILKRWPDTRAICVVDADGQHDPQELPGLFRAFADEDADLVIGARVFDQAHVPWRSRLGNKLTIGLTSLLMGRRIPDTQSGYRLHSRQFAEDIIATVAGGRYDMEMEILVKAVKEKFRIISVPIATLYEEGNRSSHFHKVRDSFQIYSRLFRAALRR